MDNIKYERHDLAEEQKWYQTKHAIDSQMPFQRRRIYSGNGFAFVFGLPPRADRRLKKVWGTVQELILIKN